MSFTRENFCRDVLSSLGNNNPYASILYFMIGWSCFETNANEGARFNLLNTTQPAVDATNYNSVGVKNYTFYEEGIQKTVETLLNGFYPNIVDCLKNNIENNLLPTIVPDILKELNTWSGNANYGKDFISTGQKRYNESFDYGSKTQPTNQPPPQSLIDEANDCWKSIISQYRGIPPTGTGIFNSWIEGWKNGHHYGPPLGWEYPSKNENGERITVQQFAGARAEWNPFLNTCTWYGINGEIK